MNYATMKKVLEDVNGASFAGMDTTVVVPLLGGKKNPMKGRITKRMTGASVMLFTNKKSNAYDNMVKRRLEQEGKDPQSFKLSPRQWGERVPNSPFVEHGGEYYLEVIFLKAGPVEYFLDNDPIAVEDIVGLKDKPEPTGQGGLENQVVIRTFKMASIDAIRIDGAEYK